MVPDTFVFPGIPDEFKSIVRRVSKRLLDNGPDVLRDSYNRFISLLNSGAPIEAIQDAGDELDNVYQDCRWSSARWYELGRSVGVPIQWVDCE